MTTINFPDWVKDAVFYQIFVDRFSNGDPGNDPVGVVPWGSPPTRDNFFGGDIQGIIDRLPYLQNLGITAIYLTPIFQAGTNHKYDTCDYLKIDPSFGSHQLFSQLVQKAHSLGIRVVLDGVFNHCGDGFWAFQDLIQNGEASKFINWFYPTTFPICQNPPNYQTCGGAAYLPKLNISNPEVREYLLNAATYWLREFKIDGWRLDVPWKVDINFWRIFRGRVKRINPEAYIVGEVWRDPKPWLNGDSCDGIMNYPLREYILDFVVRDAMDAEDFNQAITSLHELYGPSVVNQLNLLGSQDTQRILSLCKNNYARLTLAATFLFTYFGAPMIYYGDETGLLGENDPDCRRCMSWDESNWQPEITILYKKLINVRKHHPALRVGDFIPLWIFNEIYVYLRRFENDEVIVLLNPRGERHDIKIPINKAMNMGRVWHDLLGGNTYHSTENFLKIDTVLSQSVLLLVPN